MSIIYIDWLNIFVECFMRYKYNSVFFTTPLLFMIEHHMPLGITSLHGLSLSMGSLFTAVYTLYLI